MCSFHLKVLRGLEGQATESAFLWDLGVPPSDVTGGMSLDIFLICGLLFPYLPNERVGCLDNFSILPAFKNSTFIRAVVCYNFLCRLALSRPIMTSYN